MIIFDFSPAWYILFGIALGMFVVFSAMRKSTKGAARFGLIGLLIGGVSEGIGISLNLWNYTGGNWPVILWLLYFLYTAAFYQMFKVLDKKL